MNMCGMHVSRLNQTFSVPFHYPVHFGRDVFRPDNPLLAGVCAQRDEAAPHKALVFMDGGLAQADPALVDKVETFFSHVRATLELVKPVHVVTGGEAVKNDYRLIMEMVDTILEYRLCRHSYVMVVGGGAVLDAVGFAASLVHRGLRTIRIPTTTLAQNDAGVGVKTGMNLHGGKNTIGTFHPPFAVINDVTLLDTLPDEHWIAGVAEAFKVALIKDAEFFHALCTDAKRFRARDASAQERMIAHTAQLHLEHIRRNGDPFEMGRARPLDFGHWSAHKLEAMSRYRIGHGAAVAVGLAIDATYAVRQGWLEEADRTALLRGLVDTGFPLWYPELGRRLGDGTLEVLSGLADFQEHLGGALCVTFPDGVGAKREVHVIDRSCMEACILSLAAVECAERP